MYKPIIHLTYISDSTTGPTMICTCVDVKLKGLSNNKTEEKSNF